MSPTNVRPRLRVFNLLWLRKKLFILQKKYSSTLTIYSFVESYAELLERIRHSFSFIYQITTKKRIKNLLWQGSLNRKPWGSLTEDDNHCDVKLCVTFNKLLALKNFFSPILIMFQQQNLSIIRTFEERINAYMYFIVENALCQDLRNLNNLHQEIIVNTPWYILGFLATNFFSLVCMLLFKKYN